MFVHSSLSFLTAGNLAAQAGSIFLLASSFQRTANSRTSNPLFHRLRVQKYGFFLYLQHFFHLFFQIFRFILYFKQLQIALLLEFGNKNGAVLRIGGDSGGDLCQETRGCEGKGPVSNARPPRNGLPATTRAHLIIYARKSPQGRAGLGASGKMCVDGAFKSFSATQHFQPLLQSRRVGYRRNQCP